MKCELRIEPHGLESRAGENTVEIWLDGDLIGKIYAMEGPQIKLISKYPRTKMFEDDMRTVIAFGEVTINERT